MEITHADAADFQKPTERAYRSRALDSSVALSLDGDSRGSAVIR